MSAGVDPRTPVLVGAGVVQQREEDPARAEEPLALMARALELAAEDAGSRALLARADVIRAPRGFWDYEDPCRQLAERFGASSARTEIAEIGVLQTTLFGRAAEDIAEGRADIVLVTGGEARHRALRARIAGVPAPLTHGPPGEADCVLRPSVDVVTPTEIALIPMPVHQFSVMDNALRFAEGQSIADQRAELGALWARFAAVAADNPDAWRRDAPSADAIREPSDKNPMLAFPYTKSMTSQWNVDQAAGLIFCSLETARRLGVPDGKRVYPQAVADSNHAVPLSERRHLHRVPGIAHAAERALSRAGLTADEVAHLELYSCFPVAVRAQCRALGIDPSRSLTVTGGMAYAGGPLNNFVLQALAKMATVLRDDPGSSGLVTAVSGIFMKQGVSLWSTEPPARGFHFDDVSEAVSGELDAVEVVGDGEGDAVIAGYTVFYEGAKPSRAVLLCDLEDGRRTLRAVEDPDAADAMTREEHCGRTIELRGRSYELRT